MKVLRDIWILTDTGIVLFNRTYEENIDEQLFGGLLSALNSFAEEISKGGLTNFEIENKRFTILKRNNLLFIANSSKRFKERKVYEELEEVVQKFFQLYPHHVLEDWDNDVSIFKNFKNQIEGSLEETIERFRDAFW